MRRRTIRWQAAVGVLGLLAGASALAGARDVFVTVGAGADRDCETVAREFTDYPLVYAGPEFDGQPLSGCQRVVTPVKYNLDGSVREPAMDYFVFTYGGCVPAEEEGGCTPPLQIITDPPCAPTLSPAAVREVVNVRDLNLAVKMDGSLRIEAADFKATIYALAGTYEANKQEAIAIVQTLRGANARAAALTLGSGLDVPVGGSAVCS